MPSNSSAAATNAKATAEIAAIRSQLEVERRWHRMHDVERHSMPLSTSQLSTSPPAQDGKSDGWHSNLRSPVGTMRSPLWKDNASVSPPPLNLSTAGSNVTGGASLVVIVDEQANEISRLRSELERVQRRSVDTPHKLSAHDSHLASSMLSIADSSSGWAVNRSPPRFATASGSGTGTVTDAPLPMTVFRAAHSGSQPSSIASPQSILQSSTATTTSINDNANNHTLTSIGGTRYSRPGDYTSSPSVTVTGEKRLNQVSPSALSVPAVAPSLGSVSSATQMTSPTATVSPSTRGINYGWDDHEHRWTAIAPTDGAAAISAVNADDRRRVAVFFQAWRIWVMSQVTMKSLSSEAASIRSGHDASVLVDTTTRLKAEHASAEAKAILCQEETTRVTKELLLLKEQHRTEVVSARSESQAEIRALSDTLRAVEEQADALVTGLQASETSVAGLQQEVSVLKSECAVAVHAREDAEAALASANKELRALARNLDASSSKRIVSDSVAAEAQELVQAAEARAAAMVRAAEEHADAVAAAAAEEIDNAEKAASEAQKAAAETRSALAAAQAGRQSAEALAATWEAEVASTRAQVDSLRHSLAEGDRRAAMTASDAHTAELASIGTAHAAELTLVRNELEAAMNEKEQLQSALARARDETVSVQRVAEAEIASLKEDITALRADCDVVKARAEADVSDAVDAAAMAVAESDARGEEAVRQLEEKLQSEIHSLREQVDALTSAHATAMAGTQDLRQVMTQQEEQREMAVIAEKKRHSAIINAMIQATASRGISICGRPVQGTLRGTVKPVFSAWTVITQRTKHVRSLVRALLGKSEQTVLWEWHDVATTRSRRRRLQNRGGDKLRHKTIAHVMRLWSTSTILHRGKRFAIRRIATKRTCAMESKVIELWHGAARRQRVVTRSVGLLLGSNSKHTMGCHLLSWRDVVMQRKRVRLMVGRMLMKIGIMAPTAAGGGSTGMPSTPGVSCDPVEVLATACRRICPAYFHAWASVSKQAKAARVLLGSSRMTLLRQIIVSWRKEAAAVHEARSLLHVVLRGALTPLATAPSVVVKAFTAWQLWVTHKQWRRRVLNAASLGCAQHGHNTSLRDAMRDAQLAPPAKSRRHWHAHDDGTGGHMHDHEDDDATSTTSSACNSMLPLHSRSLVTHATPTKTTTAVAAAAVARRKEQDKDRQHQRYWFGSTSIGRNLPRSPSPRAFRNVSRPHLKRAFKALSNNAQQSRARVATNNRVRSMWTVDHHLRRNSPEGKASKSQVNLEPHPAPAPRRHLDRCERHWCTPGE